MYTLYGWLDYEREAKIYGPLITYRTGWFSPPTIMITSIHHAIELMDKRGATTADRAENVVAHELTGYMGLLFSRVSRFK